MQYHCEKFKRVRCYSTFGIGFASAALFFAILAFIPIHDSIYPYSILDYGSGDKYFTGAFIFQLLGLLCTIGSILLWCVLVRTKRYLVKKGLNAISLTCHVFACFSLIIAALMITKAQHAYNHDEKIHKNAPEDQPKVMSEREKRDKEPKYVSDVYPVLLWIAAALFSVSLAMSLVLFYSGDKNDRLCGRHEQNSLYEEGDGQSLRHEQNNRISSEFSPSLNVRPVPDEPSFLGSRPTLDIERLLDRDKESSFGRINSPLSSPRNMMLSDSTGKNLGNSRPNKTWPLNKESTATETLTPPMNTSAAPLTNPKETSNTRNVNRSYTIDEETEPKT